MNLYPPSNTLNIFLPVVIPLTFITTSFVILVQSAFNNLAIGLAICILSFIFCIMLSVLVYILKKRYSNYFSIEVGKFIIKYRSNILKEYDIESIKEFLVESSISLEAIGPLRKIDFYIVDKTNKKDKIYCNDIGNHLIKGWKEFANDLELITKKKVLFEERIS
jgi:hypothetical protein